MTTSAEREYAIVERLRKEERFYDSSGDEPAELDIYAVLAVIARLTMRVEDLEAQAERRVTP